MFQYRNFNPKLSTDGNTLYSLLADELYQALYRMGYANDITILCCGKFVSVVSDMMQTAPNAVRKTKGLSVNPFKTRLVIFTNKHTKC